MRGIVCALLAAGLVFAPAAAGQKKDKSRETVFKKLDRNGDGKIDKTEFEGRRGRNAERKSKAFAKMDANGDGVLTLEEFTAAGQKRTEKRKR